MKSLTSANAFDKEAYRERWNAFLKGENLTVAQFTEKTSVSRTAFFKWKQEGNFPDNSSIKKIASAFPRLNWNWLLFGNGEKFLKKKEVQSIEVIA